MSVSSRQSSDCGARRLVSTDRDGDDRRRRLARDDAERARKRHRAVRADVVGLVELGLAVRLNGHADRLQIVRHDDLAQHRRYELGRPGRRAPRAARRGDGTPRPARPARGNRPGACAFSSLLQKCSPWLAVVRGGFSVPGVGSGCVGLKMKYPATMPPVTTSSVPTPQATQLVFTSLLSGTLTSRT